MSSSCPDISAVVGTPVLTLLRQIQVCHCQHTVSTVSTMVQKAMKELVATVTTVATQGPQQLTGKPWSIATTALPDMVMKENLLTLALYNIAKS